MDDPLLSVRTSTIKVFAFQLDLCSLWSLWRVWAVFAHLSSLLSWAVRARGSLWLPRAPVPRQSRSLSSGLCWLPSACLLLFPIFSETNRDWMKSVHPTWVCRATHRSSFLQDFSFLSTKALYRFSFLNFLPPEHFPLFSAVFIPPSSCREALNPRANAGFGFMAR